MGIIGYEYDFGTQAHAFDELIAHIESAESKGRDASSGLVETLARLKSAGHEKKSPTRKSNPCRLAHGRASTLRCGYPMNFHAMWPLEKKDEFSNAAGGMSYAIGEMRY